MLLIIVTNIHKKNELWCDFFKNLCLVHYIYTNTHTEKNRLFLFYYLVMKYVVFVLSFYQKSTI